MIIFFPNGSVRLPLSEGPDIHRFNLVRGFSQLGHTVRTLPPDQNPLADIAPSRSSVQVVRLLRSADVLYVRVNEGVGPAVRLSLPPWRLLVPRSVKVVWEVNLSPYWAISSSRRRTPSDIHHDVRLLKRAAKRVDGAIAVTERVAAEVQALGVRQVLIVPNAADADTFKPDWQAKLGSGKSNRTLRVAWIGSHDNAIHDIFLLEGLSRVILDRKLPIELHIWGRASVRASTATVNHGPANVDDLARGLARMDVGLVVYNVPCDGGSPLKLLDYLSSGLVPVCSPGTAIREIVGDDIAIVRDWTPHALSEELMRLHRSPDELSARQTRARALAERLSWEAATQRIVSFIKGL